MTNDTIKYYTRKISDANPTEIISIVLELAETYLDEAIMANKEDNMDAFTISIEKAQKCITDLIDSLNMEYEISGNLLDIYLFMQKELSLASVKRDANTVAKIQAFVTKIKNSFKELSKQDNRGPAMGNAQEVYAGLKYGKGTLNESTSIQSNRGFTV